MSNNNIMIIGRLLHVERLSRELAGLVADHANHAEGAEARAKRMKAAWEEIVRHVAVVDRLAKPAPQAAGQSSQPRKN